MVFCKALKISAAAAACGSAALLGAARWAYGITYYSPKKRRADPYDIFNEGQYAQYYQRTYDLVKEMDGIPYERVEILSTVDGVKLVARYYQVREGAPVMIQCHGYRGTALRDFCGGNKLARESGYNTLVIDQRAHGESEGKTITFGVKEKCDVRDWAYYVSRRFGSETDIILAGISMGAATVLMASELDLPEQVCAVIADCPYSDQVEIIKKVGAERGFPAEPAIMLNKLAAKVWGGFTLEGRTALDAVAHTKIPVLLLHGDDDRFVPCDMSRALDSACASEHELHVFPGAGHGLCYMSDTPRYCEIVNSFLKKHVRSMQ
ncbi:MAG: alpha/beta hydrolase [Clostridia bacterium]|nr:alpha/beta hydrolase [Clostridia bacterium]